MRAEARTARAAPLGSTAELFERVGRDHALTFDELRDAGPFAPAEASAFWDLYQRDWRRFCGSRLDPQFWRLSHPGRWTGSIRVPDGAPVVIVGTGPSLRPMLPELRRVRPGVQLFTSPRGADALAEVGLVPDLLLIEHQTALDAHFSASDLSHRRTRTLSRAPLVVVDAKTPPALLADVHPDRVLVVDPLPTWGLWPATAAALALASGTHAVALVGVDLGTRFRPDPAHAPLRDLLGVLAARTDVSCVDVGAGGAPKPNWHLATLERVSGSRTARALDLDARAWLTVAERHARAADAYRRMAPLVEQAEATLAAACLVRDGASGGDVATLRTRLVDLLAGALPQRVDVQEGLGAAFLPRFLRTAPDLELGRGLWRPAALAAHELIQQYRTLGARLAGEVVR